MSNRVYLGWAFAGELRNEAAHEPLVDRLTWERANRVRAPKPPQGAPTPLGGLVRCWSCRYTMSAAHSPYKDGWVPAYRCRRDHSAGRCPRPAFALADPLLALVVPTFFELLGGDLVARPAVDATRSALEELQRRRERLVHARDEYRDNPEIQAALPPRDYAEGLVIRQRQIDEVDRAIGEEIARQPVATADATTLRLRWPELDVCTQRRMLHAVIGAVVVRPPDGYRQHGVPLRDRARLLRSADLPADLPRPGRNPAAPRHLPGVRRPSVFLGAAHLARPRRSLPPRRRHAPRL